MGRRFRRRPSATFWLLLLFAAFVTIRVLWFRSPDNPALSAGDAQVVAINLDGTLQITDASSATIIPVSLIGVDFGSDNRPACDWLQQQLPSSAVRIELDKRRRDTDGKSLAYVHYHGHCVNAELLRRGLALYAPYPGDSTSMAKVLRAAADEWRAAKHMPPSNQAATQR